MNKLNGFEFRSYNFPMRSSWNNLNENLLDLCFNIEDSETIWDKFNVTMNSKGEVIQCSSLMSATDNINYYITMGENLKRIKSFCENKGKELFIKVEDVSNENDKEIKYNKLKELEKEYSKYL